MSLWVLAGSAVARADTEHWQIVSVTADPVIMEQLRSLPVLVEGGTATRLHLHLRAADRQLLDERNIEYQLVVADKSAARPPARLAREPGYHSAEEVTARLHELAAEHSDIARVLDLGTSWQGRPITGLLVSDQPGLREPNEPALRVLGTHHGDEWSAMEVALAVPEAILANYPNDPRLRALVDHNELWFVPVVNPDGLAAFSRRNSRGVDLNRNYSYLWQPGPYAGEQPFSEVEADAIRTLSMTRSFFHGLSLHSGASNLGWVWNHTTDPSPDSGWMQTICEDYLAATEQPEFWITNGAEWYITYGDTNDWSYGVRGGHDYTLEVSIERSPEAALIETFVDYHLQPSIDFLLAGFEQGIRGTVTSSSGRPLEARVLPSDPAWPTWTDPETGAFARPLLPGSYQVTVSAEGHQSQTLPVLVPDDDSGAVELLVELAATASLVVPEVSGLEHSAALGGEGRICADDLVAVLTNQGRILLDRPGLGGPYELDWSEAAGSDGRCVSVELDPTAITEPWLREGEWHLLAEDGSAQTLVLLPLAVLLVSTAPGYSVDSLQIQGQAAALQVDIEGKDLPVGAAIRFTGPSGQRAAPSQRLGKDSAEQISIAVDASDWSEGLWSIRVFGNGHWAALPGAIRVDPTGIAVNSEAKPPAQPIPWPDSDKGAPPAPAGELPQPDPEDAGSGCACSSAESGASASIFAMLVLALGMGYFRRAESGAGRREQA